MIDKRQVPEVNAGSMADIAFLLLIFFLVVTTMNVDTGLNRILPQLPDKEEEKPIEIKERNLLFVYVSRFDQIMVNRDIIDISQLKDKAKEFILNVNDSENLPEKEIINIPLIGNFPVSKGVISLQNDRGTSYDMYIKVQNELTRAINEIRNSLAQEKFGRNIGDLSKEQVEAIQKAVPPKISEAEPRNIEGGK